MSFFKSLALGSGLFKAGSTASAPLKLNPIGIGVSAISGFSSAFNKDRYKSEYHYATRDIEKQTDQLKSFVGQAKKNEAELQRLNKLQNARNNWLGITTLNNSTNTKKTITSYWWVGVLVVSITVVLIIKLKR